MQEPVDLLPIVIFQLTDFQNIVRAVAFPI